MSIIYTFKEKTEKKHPLSFAIEQAKAVLKNTHNCDKLCVNTLKDKTDNALYTVVEIDQIVNDLVSDSLFYRS